MADNLNDQQKQVVQHFDGLCVVIASPGSGKSTAITHRIGRLIQRGIDPSNIMTITFTNKAAKEMQEKVHKKLGIAPNDTYISTFHKFCLILLRKYGSTVGYTGNINIIDTDDQKDLMKKCAKELQIEVKELNIDLDFLLSQINSKRQNLQDKDEIVKSFDMPEKNDLAQKYLQTCIKNNLIDFSGLLYEAVVVLQNNLQARKKIQDKYKYVQVDEVQDTSMCQFRLLQLIYENHKNFLCVGDLSQGVYSFRGARIQNIQQFIENKKPKIINLGTNYRSTQKIVKTADLLINHNNSHVVIDLKSANQQGHNVRHHSCFDTKDQASQVISRIKYYVNNMGYDYKDVAILYRLNKLSLQIQTSLAKSGIPFHVSGGMNFFSRKEIKDVLAMMRLAINPNDVLSFHRLTEVLKGLGGKAISDIQTLARQQHSGNIIKSCKSLSKTHSRQAVRDACEFISRIYSKDFDSINSGSAMDYFVENFKYKQFLLEEQKKDGQAFERTENIQQLIVNAQQFENSIDKYLQNIALTTSSDDQNQKNAVNLMTCHASKGLEWPICFLIDWSQQISPCNRGFMQAQNVKERMDHLQEQTRLAYVSITRAKKHCQIFSPLSRPVRQGKMIKNVKTIPSQFLVEAGIIKQSGEYRSYYIKRLKKSQVEDRKKVQLQESKKIAETFEEM